MPGEFVVGARTQRDTHSLATTTLHILKELITDFRKTEHRSDILPPIAHLYFFDDLTYHINRLSTIDPDVDKLDALRISRRMGWELLLCLEPTHQDATLVPWEHALSQLLWQIRTRERPDVLVSQGANGEYALDSINQAYQKETGRPIAELRENIRIAHFLNDTSDPFHSDFSLGSSSTTGLSERAAEIANISGHSREVHIAVFDDCIQTGEGTRRVLAELKQAFGLYSRSTVRFSTLSFIGCEATLDKLRSDNIDSTTGVLLRGQTYPETWSNDIYFLKDLFLPNSLRFSDGTQGAYVDDERWMARIFGRNHSKARDIVLNTRDQINNLGLFVPLVNL